MLTIQSIGKTVRDRRHSIGLTQSRLAKFSRISRQTVQQLESGKIKDLSFQRLSTLLRVLGLDFDAISSVARDKKRGLWMAAKTSSVSYRNEITSDQLQHALVSGNIPTDLESNLLHFLNEAPIEIVVMAVEESAQLQSTDPAKVWSNIAKFAEKLGASRREMWA